MANKKLQIEVEVNSSQVDQAVEKTGKLVDLGKGLKIQYDIDGKPLDVVIDKSLNLQKQVRALTAELRKTKEGTAEFKLLSTALNDTQDKLAQSNAKSRDLLGSLQLIPGPVGQIASQLNGAISVLKTFSSFSLKDLRFQFGETINDIKDIGRGFLGLNKNIDDISSTSTKGADGLNGISQSAAAASNSTKQLATQTSIYNQATDDLMVKNNIQIRQFPQMVNGVEELTYAVRTADGSYRSLTASEITAMKSGKGLQLTQEGLIVTTEGLTMATRGLTVALNLLKVAFGGLLIAGAIMLLTKLYEVLKEWVTGAKAAAKENEILAGSFKALQNGIKGTEDVLKTQGQVALNEAKKRGASINELTAIEKKNLEDRVQANKDALKAIEREQMKLQVNSVINEEQRKERQKEIDDAIAENSKKAGDLRLERILLNSNSEVSISKDRDDRLMKDLDARIKLEIDKENTNKKELEKLLDDKLKLRKKYEKLSQNEIKVILEENKKITKNALNEDSKVLQDYLQKTEDIRISAIKDEEQRQLEARANKRYFDVIALSADTQFQKKSKEEQDAILTNLEEAFQNDILKIKETFFLKRFQQQQDIQLKENELYTKGAEVELAVNQQRIDDATKFSELYGDTIFGNKGLKKMMEARFVDLRKAYNDEYTANEEQFRKDENALRISLENKKLTQEQFDLQMEALRQKRIQNAQTNTERQIQLDKLEVDSKRASADMTIQIAQNLAGLIGAIAGKNIKLQKAAAILDAGVSIARIITDTSRGIIAFSTSVAPLGPAGVPIAAAYATKAKISAALGIATIVAQGIGKLKSIDENSLSGEGSGGGQQSSSTTRGMEKGGVIRGKRHAEGGALIEAEGGEAVMTRGAVSLFGPMLSMMNQAGGGTSFNSNLLTTRQDNPILSNPAQEQAPIIVKSYVVEKDMVSQMNKQARLKDLSTL